MKAKSNSADIALGQAMLSRLPHCYFSILKRLRLDPLSSDRVACTFEVPGIGVRTASASTSLEAIRSVLIELTSLLDAQYFSEDASDLPSPELNGGEESLSTSISSTSSGRFQSKTRQATVGVTMPSSLRNHLYWLAKSRGASFAEVARTFAVFGFEDFEEKSLFVSSNSLFGALCNELNKWPNSEYEQVMLRLDPGHAARIRTAAKEYGKSASELSVLCMAHGFVLEDQLVSLEEKISKCKGPAIRSLVANVGLEQYATPLISGVLVGHIRPPKPLLKRLAMVFDSPETLLNTLFRQSFKNRAVPAFKSENGKPEVSAIAVSWPEAVKSLGLPPEQTKALLEISA